MDYSKIEQQAANLHSNAKNGTLKYNGIIYNFIFSNGVYEVHGQDGIETRLNTRKLTVARKWFKDWMES